MQRRTFEVFWVESGVQTVVRAGENKCVAVIYSSQGIGWGVERRRYFKCEPTLISSLLPQFPDRIAIIPSRHLRGLASVAHHSLYAPRFGTRP